MVGGPGDAEGAWRSHNGIDWTQVSMSQSIERFGLQVFAGSLYQYGGDSLGIISTNIVRFWQEGNGWTAWGKMPASLMNFGDTVCNGALWAIGGEYHSWNPGTEQPIHYYENGVYKSTDAATWEKVSTLSLIHI